MNTTRMFRKFVKSINVIVILMTVISQLGWGVNKVAAETSNPQVISGAFIDVHNNTVFFQNWPVGADVTISIDETGMGADWDYLYTFNSIPESNFIYTIAPLTFQIQAGQFVQFSDGFTTRSFTIPDVRVTAVDSSADTVSGVAPAGSSVQVQPNNYISGFSFNIDALTLGSGIWMANFSTIFDLVPESGNIKIVQGVDPDYTLGVVFMWEQGPWFDLLLADDKLETFGWPFDASLTLTITDPVSGDTVFTKPVTNTRSGGMATFEGLGGILPGFTVTLTDEVITKSLLVSGLTLSVDQATDQFSGMADPNAWLEAEIGGNGHAFRVFQAAGDGSWMIDFSEPGGVPGQFSTAHIAAGTGGYVAAYDSDHDTLRINMEDIPYTTLHAHVVDWNKASGVVHINGVDTDMPTTPFTWEWGDGSVTDGWFPQAHVYADTSRDYQVHVIAHHGDGSTPSVVVPVIFNVPDYSTKFNIWLSSNGVHGYNWPLGDLVTLEVDDPTTSDSPDFTFTDTPHTAPWDPFGTVVEYNLDGLVDFQPGFIVTMTDGTVTRNQIIPDIRITNVNVVAETVSGTSPAFMHINVNVGGINRDLTANSSGYWTADFSVVGPNPGEIVADIGPGSGGSANAIDDDGDGTGVDWYVSNPIVEANLLNNRVQGRDWPMTATITLAINDPGNGDPAEYTASTTFGQNPENPSDPNDLIALFDLKGLFTLEAGDVVTLTDSVTTRTLTVSSLAITAIDPVEKTISGTAEPNIEVSVWVNNIPKDFVSGRVVTSDESGKWTADLKLVGSDFSPGTNGGAAVKDSLGNGTWADWRVPNPSFTVRANNDQIEAWEWPLGSTLTVKIYASGIEADPADYTTSGKVTGPAPWGDPRNYVYFNLNGDFDIQPGYLVTVSDGTTIKRHIVTSLAFDVMDKAADTVSGFAEAGSRVDLWACDNTNCYNRHVTADTDGKWIANWKVEGPQDDEKNTFDIVRGTWIDSQQWDDDGDRTMFGKNVPNPYIEASPGSHWVHGRDWPTGTEIMLTIDDPNTPQPVDYTGSAVVQHNPDNPGDPSDIAAFFNLNNVFDLQAGQTITLAGGGITKTYTIQSLQVTAFDLDADTVSGTGNAGHQLQVCVNMPGNCVSRYVTVNGDGNWTADYQNPGSQPDEQEAVNIQNGTNGWVADTDEDGDRTWYDWRVLNPYIFARMGNNRVEAWDWPVGTLLTLTIEDSATTKSPDYTATQTAELSDPNKISSGTVATFELGSDYTLKSGDIVTVSGGVITKANTVADIHVTAVDVDKDIVSGTAGAGIDRVVVRIWSSPYTISRWVDVIGGTWQADFSVEGTDPSAGPGENNIWNIKPGDDGVVRVDDEDGDATSDYWQVPNVPNPNFSARAQFGDQVEAFDWPLGSTVTLLIDDPANGPGVDYTSDPRVVGLAPWDPNQTYAFFALNGVYDIQPGFEVSVTDGTTLKIHTVTNLAFTDIDIDKNIVSGIANPNARVDVWACDDTHCVNRNLIAGGDGKWSANFAVPDGSGNPVFDLVYGTWVDSQEWDDDSDRTMFGRNIPNTHIEAQVWANRVQGFDFIPGADVTVRVDDPSTPDDPDFEQTQSADGNGWVEFFPSPGIAPGFVVTMTDGTTTKTLVVSVLHATADETANTVFGVASPNTQLWFWLEDFNPGDGFGLNVSVSALVGYWSVDLDSLYTLHTWNFGGVNETDPDGDVTYYRWRVVHPTIEAWLNENSLRLFDWPLGAELSITIEDPFTTQSPDYETSVTTTEVPWFEGAWAYLQPGQAFQFAPGMQVTVSGAGITDVVFTILSLSVTGADVEQEVVTGTADPDTAVEVYLGIGGPGRTVVSDGSGHWSVDFSVPDAQGNTADIAYGTDIVAFVRDADMDTSIFEYQVLQPLHFAVYADESSFAYDDYVAAYNWPQGASLMLTIDDPGTGQSLDYTETRTVSAVPGHMSGNYPGVTTLTRFPLAGVFDIQPGFIVTISDGTTTHTQTVAVLAVTTFDANTDTVAGTAEPGAEVTVVVTCNVFTEEICARRSEIADGSGLWTADFSVADDEPWEDAYDIPAEAGSAGYVYLADADNDETRAAFAYATTPPPGFTPTSEVVVPAGEPIKVAVAVDLSGDAQQIGQSALKAVQMALEDYGLLQGFALTAQSFDAGCAPDLGETAAQDIVSDASYVGVIGHVCSISYIAGLPIYEAAGLVSISGSTTYPYLGYYAPTVFHRTVFDDLAINSGFWLPEIQSLPDVQAWRAEYESRFGSQPDDFAVLYYDATRMLLQRIAETAILQDNGSLLINRAALAAAVRNTSQYQGVSGCIAFDSHGNRIDIGTDTDDDCVPDMLDNAPMIYNPDQRDVDGDGTADVLDPCPADATNTCNTAGSAAAVIGAEGGTVATENNKVALDVPAGATTEPTSFSITDYGGGYEVAVYQGTMLVVHSYSLQPHGTLFDPPAAITFGWEDADNNGIVDGTTLRETNLLLIKDGMVISPACGVNPDCDMTANTLTVQVTSLSLFELVAPLDSDGDGLNDDVDACPDENPNDYDADGNGCTDTAVGLRQYIANLPANVVPSNIKTSLLAKVDSAISSLNRGKEQAAIGQLRAFINEVEAQRGKKISVEIADLLIAYARNVIAKIP